MKKRSRCVLSVLLASALLAGCSSAQTSDVSDINIVDAEGYTSAPETSATVSSSSSEESEPVTETSDTQHITEEIPPAADSEEATLPQSSSQTHQETVSAPSEEPEQQEPVTTPPTTSSTTPPSTSSEPTVEAPISSSEQQETEEPVEVPGDFGVNTYETINYSEVQGVWISYLELADMLMGKSESVFRSNISQAFDNISGLGSNTVYIHVRSHGDAYYESKLFPWSKYASGAINTSPSFDPLEIVIEEAHSRGISVQAWINPLRLCSKADMVSYGDYPVTELNDGERVVEVNGYYYLNPAYDDVIELISDGAAEIVASYDVDGLHIDDYFYPTTDASFDSTAFNDSSFTVLSEFRFSNCDKLVESIYDAVKASNPRALFSVSCQGSIENNYNLMYADVEKWCTESGYLDYIVPQIYYGFDNSTQPYSQCLSRWEALASEGGIPLVVGLTVAKIGYEDKWAGDGRNEWLTDSAILARQLTEAMECTSYGGASLYSYKSIFGADSSVKAQVGAEIEEYKQIINTDN
ncbi:MAG: family 10 glycosylhydrolase [Oscillospiraceae bacterium]|nr:family 10 glycosylhydrolase [Oscillospiraceae bacterium]